MIKEGCQETGHLLCTWHFERTLKKYFKKTHLALQHLLAVLYTQKTRPGAEASLENALRACEKNKKTMITDIAYIRDCLIPVLPLWAYCFCEHSSFLLQIPTTSLVELWHFTLKTKSIKKDTLQQFSLCGISRHVLAVAKQWDLRSEEAYHK
jgi:hypothetical protein